MVGVWRTELSACRPQIEFEPVDAHHSGKTVPEPPISAGKSFSFGKPSFIGSTVSA